MLGKSEPGAKPVANPNPDAGVVRPNLFKEYGMLSLGTLFIALGVYFFKFPNNFSTGGVSGMSIILGHYFPSISPGSFVFIINQALLVIGFIIFGRGFGFRTAYVSLLMSGAIWVLERVLPMKAPMTSQPLLELVFAVTLPAVGSAILFNMQASSGGTDIVAMILRKYTSLNIGNCLLCVDFIITVLACVAFGMETGLFSVLGLMFKSVMVDMVLENIKIHKCFQIITTHPKPIVEYIVKELKRGATELDGQGAFTHENKTVIMTVVTRAQAVQLRRYARGIDPACFILIMNTGEIIGKGFRGEL